MTMDFWSCDAPAGMMSSTREASDLWLTDRHTAAIQCKYTDLLLEKKKYKSIPLLQYVTPDT